MTPTKKMDRPSNAEQNNYLVSTHIDTIDSCRSQFTKDCLSKKNKTVETCNDVMLRKSIQVSRHERTELQVRKVPSISFEKLCRKSRTSRQSIQLLMEKLQKI